MLTRRQLELYNFIRDYKSKEGVAPSLREMEAHLGLNSLSGVHRLLMGLEERGAIKRMKDRARAIRILDESAWRDA